MASFRSMTRRCSASGGHTFDWGREAEGQLHIVSGGEPGVAETLVRDLLWHTPSGVRNPLFDSRWSRRNMRGIVFGASEPAAWEADKPLGAKTQVLDKYSPKAAYAFVAEHRDRLARAAAASEAETQCGYSGHKGHHKKLAQRSPDPSCFMVFLPGTLSVISDFGGDSLLPQLFYDHKAANITVFLCFRFPVPLAPRLRPYVDFSWAFCTRSLDRARETFEQYFDHRDNLQSRMIFQEDFWRSMQWMAQTQDASPSCRAEQNWCLVAKNPHKRLVRGLEIRRYRTPLVRSALQGDHSAAAYETDSDADVFEARSPARKTPRREDSGEEHVLLPRCKRPRCTARVVQSDSDSDSDSDCSDTDTDTGTDTDRAGSGSGSGCDSDSGDALEEDAFTTAPARGWVRLALRVKTAAVAKEAARVAAARETLRPRTADETADENTADGADWGVLDYAGSVISTAAFMPVAPFYYGYRGVSYLFGAGDVDEKGAGNGAEKARMRE